MSERISYAQACRDAANYIAVSCEMPGPVTPAAPDAPVRTLPAVLRALAERFEHLTRHLPPVPEGYVLTASGIREFITDLQARDFAAFCAAGFDPSEPLRGGEK